MNAAKALFMIMPVLFWFGGVVASAQDRQGVFPGDTRFSSNPEARSMSPPHWGNDAPQSWPSTAPRDLEVGNDPVWNPPLGRGNAGRLEHAGTSSNEPNARPASSTRDPEKRYPLYPQTDPRPSSSTEFSTSPSRPYDPHGQGAQYDNGLDYNDSYRDPRWGFRTDAVTRPNGLDHGAPMDFEWSDQMYPSLGEILATGRWFASAEYQLLSAKFSNNLAFDVNDASGSEGWPLDFGYRPAPRFRFGFESKLGPGFELDYFQFDHASKLTRFTTGPSNTAQASVWQIGPSEWTRLQTFAPGQTLQGRHDLEVHSLCLSFFKDYKLPRARINGMLGGRYISVAQHGDVQLLDGTGAVLDQLQQITDLRAVGPRAMVDYTRRIGHTHLELIGGIGGSLLFGNRDQFVQNTQTGINSRTSVNDLWTVWELHGGVQYFVPRGEDRAFYARLGVSHQVWIGGGSAVSPLDDFGFRGLIASIGVNR